jgi:hypothetical protein
MATRRRGGKAGMGFLRVIRIDVPDFKSGGDFAVKEYF